MHCLRVFGGLSLHDVGAPVTGRAAQRRRLALLAFLAAEHPRAVTRDRLLGHFWPDSDEERGRHLLRDSLYVLRGALGDDAILSQGDEIRLNPARLCCDLWDFEQALEADEREAAVAAYAGPFLDGVYVDGAAEFERWCEVERSRLAHRHAEALEALAESCMEAGDETGAVRWWRRLAEQDPCNTRVALQLMQALVAAGDRAGALRHAGLHTALLKDEFGAGPDPALLALADELRRESTRSLEQAPAPIVERLQAATGPAVPEESAAPAADPVKEGAHAIAPAAPPPRRSRVRALAAGAMIVLTGIVAGVVLVARAAAAVDPPRVVVVPLENRTGDPALDVVGRIAADWIMQGLALTREVQVVQLATALGATRRLVASRAPSDSQPLPDAIARETGASIVVLGSYARDGDSLRLHVTITDATTGRVLAAPSAVGASVAAPLAGIDALRERVMVDLATSINPLLRHAAPSTRPPSWQAYEAYVEGTARMIEGDWHGTLDPLRRAAALDTAFTLPLVVLGMMHFNLAEYATADSIARAADASRERLAPIDRALLDLLQAWLRHDHEAAYRAARAAADVAPGSETTAQQMAIEVRRLNRPREALRVLSSLDPTRGELRGDPYYWLNLTLAYHHVGDHRRELRAARRGRAQLPHDPIVRLTELRALAALGRTGEVERIVDDILASPARDQPVPGILLYRAAVELRAHAQPATARRLAERAVAWHGSRTEQERRTTAHRRSLADLLLLLERWDEARMILTQLALDDTTDVRLMGQLGIVAARSGDRDEGARIASLLATPGTYDGGASAHWRAAIAVQLGEHDRAVELLREAIGRGRLHEFLHEDPMLDPLRGHPGFRALMRPRG